MKKDLKNPVGIRYYAHQREPFGPDAEGYVDRSDLKDWERHPWYVRWDGDIPVGRKGYTMVRDDEEGWHVVKSSAIWSEVVEHDGLEGGYGLFYPGGGLSSTSHYDLKTEIDGQDVLLQRSHW
jgi:hypothetical protein